MKSKLFVEKPNEIEMTLQITMPLGDWRKLKNQLGTGYPVWRLSEEITFMIKKAEAQFGPKSEDEKKAEEEYYESITRAVKDLIAKGGNRDG